MEFDNGDEAITPWPEIVARQNGEPPPPRRRRRKPEVPRRWGCKPKLYEFKGEAREFYTVGALAAALSREADTIRHLERAGTLPTAPFRGPRKERLYTRPMIEAIVEIAREEGVLHRKNLEYRSTKFTERVAQVFQDRPF